MKKKKNKVIVTGGCGFIGSHVVDKLVMLGNHVHVIDDLSAKENERFYYNDQATYWNYDISKDDCSDIFSGIDYVFHLAARSRIQPTISSPGECFEVNVVGTQRIAEWSRINSVKGIIYSGTSSLYGKQNSIPFNPSMPVDCLNPYSLSKWMGEQVLRLYNQLYDMPCITLRYFNVYGPREPLKGQYAPVVGLFKKQKRNNELITVVAPGHQKRDFTYIDDVVESNICAMKLLNRSPKENFKIYNIGTGKNYSMIELANMVGGKFTIIPSRPAEVFETLADIERSKIELGWSPKFMLEDMINEY